MLEAEQELLCAAAAARNKCLYFIYVYVAVTLYRNPDTEKDEKQHSTLRDVLYSLGGLEPHGDAPEVLALVVMQMRTAVGIGETTSSAEAAEAGTATGEKEAAAPCIGGEAGAPPAAAPAKRGRGRGRGAGGFAARAKASPRKKARAEAPAEAAEAGGLQGLKRRVSEL